MICATRYTPFAERLDVLTADKRLAILAIFISGFPILSPTMVARKTGMSESSAQHHLNVLYKSGLVSRSESGRNTLYQLNEGVRDAFLTEITTFLKGNTHATTIGTDPAPAQDPHLRPGGEREDGLDGDVGRSAPTSRP